MTIQEFQYPPVIMNEILTKSNRTKSTDENSSGKWIIFPNNGTSDGRDKAWSEEKKKNCLHLDDDDVISTRHSTEQ